MAKILEIPDSAGIDTVLKIEDVLRKLMVSLICLLLPGQHGNSPGTSNGPLFSIGFHNKQTQESV